MPSTLVFPDGIRLASEEEIPGPQPRRSTEWTRIQAAGIAQGFVLKASDDARFTHYAEINVDAPRIWAVFRELCESLLPPTANLVFGGIDDEPDAFASAPVHSIIAALEPHRYQLAHDGYLQFGLVSDGGGKLDEVFVAPTKHFKVWLNDEPRFRAIMAEHGLPETSRLEFLDDYPRATVRLPENAVAFRDAEDFAAHLEREIAAMQDSVKAGGR